MSYLDLAGKFKKKPDKRIPRIEPTLKGWLTSKTITTQYESRDNLLYLVGDRNFTPLQGRDACRDL